MASGDNNNKLRIFDIRNYKNLQNYNFKAAVKAIEWSKTNSHMLISGGGLNDKTIK